jgi:para-nitrobenzyl esterase
MSQVRRSARVSPSIGRNLACALALAAASASAAETTDQPSAVISTGQLAGAVENGVAVFRGIPYAAPPVGPLRWRAPQPAAAWSGRRDAARFGPACPQGHPNGLTNIVAFGGAPEPTSEDCLTLNVWAPASGAAKAPVMVFIHGGSGVMGAGSLPYYDGASFARDGVVLVTINYRLGPLGGFAHPALSKAAPRGEPLAAYGMMDQIAALRWVKQNAAAFGGDPNNVTVFGESAGGISVLQLLAAPSAWGLFQRAIVESGGGWFPPGPGRGKAEKIGAAFAQSLGAPADATTAQLRQIPASALVSSTHPVAAFSDPRLAPENVTVAIATGRHARVPLMIGANSGEDSLLSHGGGIAKAMAGVKPGLMKKLRQLYGPNLSDETLVRNYLRDGLVTAPARWVVENWSSTAPAYVYRFDHVDERLRARSNRAGHGSELFYVFQTLGKQPADAVAPTPGDEQLAAEMHARWIAFARTGSPNPPGLQTWPAYSRASDPWMVFGPDGAAVQHQVLKPQLDWQEKRMTPLIWLMRIQAAFVRLFRWL